MAQQQEAPLVQQKHAQLQPKQMEQELAHAHLLQPEAQTQSQDLVEQKQKHLAQEQLSLVVSLLPNEKMCERTPIKN